MKNLYTLQSQALKDKYLQQLETLKQQNGPLLYDFETIILEKYILYDKMDLNLFGMMLNFIEISASKRVITPYFTKLKTFAQRDFSQFLTDYLIMRYLFESDESNFFATGKSKNLSYRLQVSELQKREINLFTQLQNVLQFLQNTIKNEQIYKFFATNIAINEQFVSTIFISRFFSVEAPTLEIEIESIILSPEQFPIKKLQYKYFNNMNEFYMSVAIGTKVSGAQFGGIIITEGAQNKKYYFKTHQEGSRIESSTGIMYLSKSISLAHPVNANELLIYKILDKIGFGPNAHFVVSPFIENQLFIITNDLSEECGFQMAGNCKNLDLSSEDLKIKATVFDIILRILMLTDINEGNYGFSADESIKLIDFRAPSDIDRVLNEQNFYMRFLNVNGNVYPKPPADNKENRLVPSILKQSCANEKLKLEEGIKAFQLISKQELEQAVNESKMEIIAFLTAQDNIAKRQMAELVGITISNAMVELNIYANTIIANYNIVEQCFQKNRKANSQ